jgi:hypothetical protein
MKWLIAVAVVLIGLVLSVVFFDAVKVVFMGTVGLLLVVIGLVMVAVAKE